MDTIQHLPAERRREIYDEAMRLRDEKGWGSWKIAKRLGVKGQTVLEWFRGHEPDTLLHHPDLSPSSELSYVIGATWSDGCVSTNNRISLAAKDKEFVDEFNKCISSVLRKEKYSIWRDGNKYKLVSRSRLLADYLKKPLSKHKNVVEEFPSEFLRGLFDGDGGVDKLESSRIRVKLSNTNIELLEYAQDLLSKLLNTDHLRIDFSGKSQKKCYSLTIDRQDDMRKFYEKVGFTINRKQERLSKLVDKLEEGREEVTWNEGELRFIRENG